MYIVIFTGGEYPEPSLASVFFNNSKNVYTVIAADSGLETAFLYQKEYNFTVDLIIGDMDSLSRFDLLERYPREIIKQQDMAKDYTDTETALIEAVRIRNETNIPLDIVLVGGGGGRLDHLLGIQRLLGTDLSPDFWLVRTQVVCLLKEKTVMQVSGLQDGDMISTFALPGCMKYTIRSHGLKWPLNSVDWQNWGRSISNWPENEAGGSAVFEAQNGLFYIVLPLKRELLLNRTDCIL